ncbi:MAG: hypothetical protein HQL40_02610 [Alphaproteobacteria bacterium]|nr:hypothetical protein [Alphaproteobacteria bacterium]
MMRRLLAALLLTLWTFNAQAQGFDLSGGDGGPIEVYADKGIEWTQDGKKFVARGNARAVRGRVTVTADSLTAHYRELNGKTEVWRLEAEGAVTIATPSETATGARASYQIDDGRFVLTGQPRLVAGNDTVSARDTIEYEEKTRTAVARGEAQATRNGRTIHSEVLRAWFKDGRDGLKMSRSEAEGAVVITTERERVTGERARYNAETGIATMEGSVKITRGENQLNGGFAEVNLDTGVSRLFAAAPGKPGGRVKGLFVPKKDEAQR